MTDRGNPARRARLALCVLAAAIAFTAWFIAREQELPVAPISREPIADASPVSMLETPWVESEAWTSSTDATPIQKPTRESFEPVSIGDPLSTLEGYVAFPEGVTPPRAMTLAIGFERTTSSFRHVNVSSSGEFRVDRLVPHKAYVLRVRTDGEVLHRESLPPLPPGVTRRDVSVISRVLAKGRVLDADTNVPLEKVRVGIDLGEGREYSYVETRRDGSFVLRGAMPSPTNEVVRARLSASVIGSYSALVELSPVALERPSPLELRIGALGQLEGTLRDSNDLPIVGASVEVQLRWNPNAEFHGPICAVTGADGSNNVFSYSTVYPINVITDESGAFRLKGFAHGAAADLQLLLIGGREFTYPVPRFDRCGEIKQLDIRMPPTYAVIEGEVTIAGKPSVASVTWRGSTVGGKVSTDAAGRFQMVGVESGVVEVTATDNKTTASVSKSIELSLHERRTLDFEIPIGKTFRGVVRDAAGNTRSGVRVIATRMTAFQPGQFERFAFDESSRSGPSPDVSTVTDADGRFELEVEDLSTSYVVEIEGRWPRGGQLLEENEGDETDFFAIAAPGSKDLVLTLKE